MAGARQGVTIAAAAAVCLAGAGGYAPTAITVRSASPDLTTVLRSPAAGLAACERSNPGSSPWRLTAIDGRLYFTANDFVSGEEVWTTDGTRAGTLLTKDIDPNIGYVERGTQGPIDLLNVGGSLFFTEYDGEHGRALWKSDGTEAGTVMVADPDPRDPEGYETGPRYLTEVAGRVFFTVDVDAGSRELWVSDGTTAGTTLVKDLGPDNAFFEPEMADLAGSLFFTAAGIDGRALWKSDGTDAGTVMVKEITSDSYRGGPYELTDMAGTLFFAADDGVHGMELWRSDGTEEGTVQVTDIRPGARGSDAGDLRNAGGTLFFTANDGVHGMEPWRSDGTDEGTVQIEDIRPGARGSGAFELTAVGNRLFFAANDGSHGSELWVSDATEDGTVLVKDISPTTRLGPRDLTAVAGRVFFTTREGGTYGHLWVSDGTEAGTALIKDFGGSWEDPGAFTAMDSTLFLSASDGIHGAELWKSDGTKSGTVMVKDINRGMGFWYGGADAHARRGTMTLYFSAWRSGRLVLRPVHGSPVRRVTHEVRIDTSPVVELRPTKAGMRQLERALRRAHRHGQHVGRLDVVVRITYTPCGLPSRTEIHHFTLKLR